MTIKPQTAAIRVAFMEGQPPWDEQAGGIASYVRHRAIILGEQGFEVFWLNERACARWNPHSMGWEDRREFASGGPLARLDLRKRPVWRYLIKSLEPDVVELPCGWSKALPKSAPGPRLVLQCHTAAWTRGQLNRDAERLDSWRRRLRARLRNEHGALARNFREADSILACSYEIALLEAGLYGAHLDRFTVIPHAFSAQAEQGFAHRAGDEHDRSFLIVGNVEYLKGFDLILAGYLHYCQQGGRALLKVAGTSGWDDPNPQVRHLLNGASAQALFAAHGRDCLRFLGRLSKDALAVERARATATLIGSRFEAFTMVAGEAFLSGCPVILSDRTGWRLPVARHSGARLMNPYDPVDLAAALHELEDPERRTFYRAGADRMAAYLQSDALIQQTVDFYRGVAEG